MSQQSTLSNLVKVHHVSFAEAGVAHATRVIEFEIHGTPEELADLAFKVTNAPPEFIREKFTETRHGRCYSTSVGDVVEVAGTFLLCCGCGWRAIDNFEQRLVFASRDRFYWKDLAALAAWGAFRESFTLWNSCSSETSLN